MNFNKAKIGILTISDRASQGVYEDQSGPAAKSWFAETITSAFEVTLKVIPDEQIEIEQALIQMADQEGCSLILTLGGTGPSKRDVTPEATLAIADKELPGFGEQMRAISLQYVPTAILSRQVGVIRGESLIINLPGQPKAIQETLGELFQSIPYCIELMDGPIITTNPEKVVAFRPKSAPPIR